MTDITMKFVQTFVLPLLVPVLVGIGSATTTVMVVNARLEERVSSLESQIQRHEVALERDFTRHDQVVSELTRRTSEQEQRMAKLDTIVEELRASLGEIRADVKTILRGQR